MKQSLNGKWKLQGFLPNVKILGTEAQISRHIITDEIDGEVPGGIHLDLYRAGIIKNPYLEDNSLACEWTESRWWCYRTEAELKKCACDKKELVFEGLDYLAEVFINKKSYGTHENMFTPMRIDISHILTDKIEIMVLFKGAGFELGQNGRTSETRTQKSRFGYKWDFGTRLVNIGIWQGVYIEYTSGARITEAKITTDTDGGEGIVNAAFRFDGEEKKNIVLTLNDPEGRTVCEKEISFENYVEHSIKVDTPHLWYPNGMGKQPLYTLRLVWGNNLQEYKVGIRKLRYLQNPGSPKDALTYTVEINGKPVYIKGNNKVPLDHLYGNVSLEDYEWCVRAMAKENVNLVRVWGGGIIETEVFYDLCDKYGILVWQDFIQSSSGIDHIPSKHADFLEKLSDAASFALKTKRNHVSLAIWTGGNELTDSNIKPATYNDENIAMLKALVEREDSEHLFLPTTPSGPIYTTVFDSEDNHDVHSPWEYFPETHYKNYNRLKLLLHSEFGISSMSSSIPLFMQRNEPGSYKYNINRHRGEYWWHSYLRDKKIYGDFCDTGCYIPYSQWTQAEGLRYIIETERRMAPYASGSMVWQLNEPWPNCDCTNLMDYFGNPKMAYYWVKKAFSDCPVSLKYDSIIAQDCLNATVCINGDDEKSNEVCSATVYDARGKKLFFREFKLNELPQSISVSLNECEEQMVFVRLCHGGTNKDYFFSKQAEEPYRVAKSVEKTKVSLSIVKENKKGNLTHIEAVIKNAGKAPAYFVNLYDKTMGHALLCSDSYFTLLPGESRRVEITVKKRCGLFFEPVLEEPELDLRGLNI
jgi:beta-mannosidase